MKWVIRKSGNNRNSLEHEVLGWRGINLTDKEAKDLQMFLNINGLETLEELMPLFLKFYQQEMFCVDTEETREKVKVNESIKFLLDFLAKQ